MCFTFRAICSRKRARTASAPSSGVVRHPHYTTLRYGILSRVLILLLEQGAKEVHDKGESETVRSETSAAEVQQ